MPDLPQKIVSNLVIGLSFIYLVMTFFYSIPKFGETEDTIMDLMIPFYQEMIPSIQEKNIPPFVLLAIDNETYENWGEATTPRDKLKNLIDAAVKEARLIIVDIDVSQPAQGASLEPNDEKLKTYLTNYVTECKAKKDKLACPYIIFARVFEASSSDIFLTPREGFLDDVIAQSSPYLQWGSVEFSEVLGKGVRRWRLWESTCSKDKQSGIIPSIELSVMGLIQGCTIKNLQDSLRPLQPLNCDDEEGYLQSLPENVTLCDLPVSTDFQSVQHRIMYRIPWTPPLVLDNADVPVLTVFSAQHYAEIPLRKDLSLKKLNGSIVVIGATHRDATDVYLTPISDDTLLPGSLVIINAVYTLLQYGTIEPIPLWIWLIIAALFIVVITTISSYSSKNLFLGMGIFVFTGLLIIISVILLYHGIWLNIVLPLMVVKIYQFISGHRENVSKLKEKLKSNGKTGSNVN